MDLRPPGFLIPRGVTTIVYPSSLSYVPRFAQKGFSNIKIQSFYYSVLRIMNTGVVGNPKPFVQYSTNLGVNKQQSMVKIY